MADAYKVKRDITLPRAIRKIGTDEILGDLYENEGINYAEGRYVRTSDITPNVRERVENGELDEFLEPVSASEADEAELALSERGTFIPEHENEAQILQEGGHNVVPKEQVLDLRSAGADDAKQALSEAKDEGRDERPGLTAEEVPALADVSRGDAEPFADDAEHVGVPEGTEQPPGIPVEAQDAPTKRQRPGRRTASQKSEDEKGNE